MEKRNDDIEWTKDRINNLAVEIVLCRESLSKQNKCSQSEYKNLLGASTSLLGIAERMEDASDFDRTFWMREMERIWMFLLKKEE